MREFVITPNEANQRMDKYLGKLLKEAPKSFFYKMLRKKNIVLNDKKATGNEKLKTGDSIKLYLSDETFDKFAGARENVPALNQKKRNQWTLEASVVYEDENVLFLNKPVGILSQKATPEDVSVNEYVIRYLLDTHAIEEKELQTFKPSICNRLDRNTRKKSSGSSGAECMVPGQICGKILSLSGKRCVGTFRKDFRISEEK